MGTRRSGIDDTAQRPDRVRVLFVMEQHVGLRTYGENLRRFADKDDRIDASWIPITYLPAGGVIERVPLLGERIKGMLRGRVQVRRALRRSTADVVMFLTQTPAVLGGRLSRRRPYVIMTDDTPLLYDQMSTHYSVAPKNRIIGAIRHRSNVRTFRAASMILPMSNWARRSLIDDYGVDDSNIDVLPTGIDLDAWVAGEPDADGGPLRILFVGGDFHRKGGPTVLDAFRRLPSGGADLHVVTKSALDPEPGVTVHSDLQPNDPKLIALFRSSHVFVFPSLAEAFPNVVVEASAAGLPCVVTDVGGMAEMVVEGKTGYLIEPNDVDGLERVLLSMSADPTGRAAMARAARERAEQLYEGGRNARRVVDHMLAAVSAAGGHGATMPTQR